MSDEVQLNLPLEPGRAECCRCGRQSNEDGSSVTWRCIQCGGTVCRRCTLVDPLERTYYDDTFCSVKCRDDRLQAIKDEFTVSEVMES